MALDDTGRACGVPEPRTHQSSAVGLECSASPPIRECPLSGSLLASVDLLRQRDGGTCGAAEVAEQRDLLVRRRVWCDRREHAGTASS